MPKRLKKIKITKKRRKKFKRKKEKIKNGSKDKKKNRIKNFLKKSKESQKYQNVEGRKFKMHKTYKITKEISECT